MKKSLCFAIVGFVVAVCLSVSSAGAATLTIVNPGFEDPVLANGGRTEGLDGTPGWRQGWYYSGWVYEHEAWNDAGAYNPTAGNYGYDDPPEGSNAGYIRSANRNSRYETLYQILPLWLETDTTYTLSAKVGNPSVYNTSLYNPDGSAPDYRIELVAGDTVIASSGQQSAPADASSTWNTTSLTFGPVSSHEQLGQPLQIRLVCYPKNDQAAGGGYSGGYQVDFDDVMLEYDNPSKAHDPKPPDGAKGVLVADATLSWKAGVDPGDPNVPNPNIIEHYLLLSEPYPLGTTSFPDKWWNEPGTQQFTIGADTDPADGKVDPNVSMAIAGLQKNRLYLWFVDEGLVGSSGPSEADPAKIIWGNVWSFETELTDAPPEVDAGDDMVTWYGQAVQLDPNVVDDGTSTLTYAWSAEPDDGVVFSATDVEAPTVTITKTGIVVIDNPGFENPPFADDDYGQPNAWTDGYYTLPDTTTWVIDASGAGAYNPSAVNYGYGGVAPEGENVMYATSYAGYDSGLRQVLSATLQADTQYDLSALVGNPLLYNEGLTADYRIELLAGGVLLASDTGPAPADDQTWKTASLTYNSGPSPAQLGQPLEIRLLAVDFTDRYQVDFDGVMLTAVGPASSDAFTVTLTLAVHDVANQTPVEDTVTIDVYDDACIAARIGKGLAAENPGDLDGNCITDFKDFALMAAKWLVDTALTEPIVK